MSVPLGTGKLHDWEDVTGSVTRLCVGGGWIYRLWEESSPPAFVFVPDYEENIAGIRKDPALARLLELLEKMPDPPDARLSGDWKDPHAIG